MTATDYRLSDSTLRDGSHAISHQYTVENVVRIVRGLDRAGIQVIEIAHGDGLGGSSFNYGFSKVPELELIAQACAVTQNARIACLLLPGIGLADDLRQVSELGVQVARIAVHCTEADITEQHIKAAKRLDMEAIGFLMMAHMNSPEGLVEQALLMDPGGVYGRMDFATRDRYRHATEEIARKCRLTEGEVAHKAVELARAGASLTPGGEVSGRSGHVGFYLIDKGLPELLKLAGLRLSGAAAWRRTAGQFPLLLYLGGIVLATVIFSAALLAHGTDLGRSAGAYRDADAGLR